MNGFCGCAEGLVCRTFHEPGKHEVGRRGALPPGYVQRCAHWWGRRSVCLCQSSVSMLALCHWCKSAMPCVCVCMCVCVLSRPSLHSPWNYKWLSGCLSLMENTRSRSAHELCVCLCVRTRARMFVRVCAYVCVCVCYCQFLDTCVHINPSICVCAIVTFGVHVYINVCVCVCMCTRAPSHILITYRCHGSQGPKLFFLSRVWAHSHTTNSDFVAQNIPIMSA